ncbi:putative metallo-beta-lactamase domain protein [Microdochium bolleyi]|uniref:Putative metallo-beta-lactamase domain protein n=1 Tax=Microdochium bolleyi TaxID=196109 RepID=A0A136IXB7_9PEZI|nr:putative metallo-beta-lactamase domain protein [Microdochium bolleyi]
MEPEVVELFEPVTGTWQYIVADPANRAAVIIDSVLDYNPATATISTGSADALLAVIADRNFRIEMILETHAHADHMTAASYLQAKLARSQASGPPLIGIGKRIQQVQQLFGQKYGIEAHEYAGVFDKLWEDDEEFAIGALRARAVHLPGHTPDHMGYHVGNNVFVGDSIFQVDVGSARADFPGGNAEDIFRSCRKLLALPGDTKIWVGHDYPPAGRDGPRPYATVAEHRQQNKHVRDGVSRDEFVQLRQDRDRGLAEPKLLHQALQINIRAGRLPAPRGAGDDRLLHVPIKLDGEAW